MFDKLFTIALVVDKDFREEYKPLMTEAMEKAREGMHIGAPDQVGQIVMNRWYQDDELYDRYDNLLVDVLDADIDDKIMEALKNE